MAGQWDGGSKEANSKIKPTLEASSRNHRKHMRTVLLEKRSFRVSILSQDGRRGTLQFGNDKLR